MLELFKIVGKIALEGQDAVNRGLADVVAEARNTESGLSKTGDAMQAFGKKTTKAGSTLTKFATGPIAAVGAGLLGLTTKIAGVGDNIAKNSRQVGMSIQSYQELDYALQQVAQVSGSEVERALGRLNTRIGQARNGSSKYAEALQAIGYSQEEVASGSITSEQAFNKLVTSLQSTSSDTEAASMAVELLGDRIGRKLGPAIRQGGDQIDVLRNKFKELGLGMSEEAALASEKFNDEMDTLKRQLSAVAMQIGGELMPIMTQFVQWLQSDGVPLIKGFASVITSVASAFPALPGPIQNFIAVAAGLTAALGPVLMIVGKVISTLGMLSKGLAALRVAALATTPALIPVITALAPFIAIGAAIAAGLWVLWEAINAVVEAFGGWDAVAQKTAEALSSAWESIKEGFTKVIEFVSQGVQKIIQFYVDMYSKIWEAVQAGGSKILEMFTQFWTGVAELWMNGVTTVLEAVAQFVQGVIERIAQMPGQVVAIIQNMVQAVVDYFVNMGSMAVQAVKNMVMQVVNYVKNMAQNVINSIQQMFMAVVGNSIIPDMARGVLDEFAGMTDGAVRDTENLVKGVNGTLDGIRGNVAPTVEMGNGGSRGGQGGGQTVVDMRHSVIRDDRDMMDRMRRRGLEMTGAF